MKTLNPNFPVPDDIVTELDNWFGEGKYVPMICWNDYGSPPATYFVVVKTQRSNGKTVLHFVRLFKMHDFSADVPAETYEWATSVDVQENMS